MATVVAFAGDWDVASQKSLRRELKRLYDEPALVLDFSDVTYVDSSCLAELIIMERKRGEAGFTRATLIVRNTPVKKVLEVSGLAKLFRVAGSLDDVRHEYEEELVVEYAQRGDD